MSRALLVIISVLLGLASEISIATERLTLTGSSTIAPLALEIGKRFEQQNPGVRVDVQTGGSSRGVNDARTGLAGIGMASRALNESETDLTRPHHRHGWRGHYPAPRQQHWEVER